MDSTTRWLALITGFIAAAAGGLAVAVLTLTTILFVALCGIALVMEILTPSRSPQPKINAH